LFVRPHGAWLGTGDDPSFGAFNFLHASGWSTVIHHTRSGMPSDLIGVDDSIYGFPTLNSGPTAYRQGLRRGTYPDWASHVISAGDCTHHEGHAAPPRHGGEIIAGHGSSANSTNFTGSLLHRGNTNSAIGQQNLRIQPHSVHLLSTLFCMLLTFTGEFCADGKRSASDSLTSA